MPSCVIKYCTINSTYQNKASGITFHKFPTDTAWKEYWTKAVRANRKDDEWRPTKFSVICSLHFEEFDFYTTKAGYRRIKESGIPKKVRLVNSEWCQTEEAFGSSSILTLRRVDETNYSCSFHLKSLLGPNTEPCDCEVCNSRIEVIPADIFGNTSDKRTEKEAILEDVSNPQDINSNYQRDVRDCQVEPILPTQKKKLKQSVKRHKLRNKNHARIMRRLNVLKRKALH